MSAGIYMVLDAAFSALSAKFERDAILAKVKEAEANGATPEQIVASLKAMRDEAIAAAQDVIDKS